MMTVFGRKITNEDMSNIASYMDDEIRERLNSELAPCGNEEFIAAYLEEDPEFIEILKDEFEFEVVDRTEKKYYVTTTHGGDEFTVLKTDDKAEAIAEARRSLKSSHNNTVEIRMYLHDVEDDNCDNWDYNTLEFHAKRYAIRDREAGNVIDECDHLIEAEDLINQYEYDDKEDGTYEPDFYEIYDWDDEEVCERKLELRDRRVIAHLKQRELADAAGISIKTLQDYEGGRKDINGAAAGTVKKLAEALGCRMEDLID